MYKNKNGEKNNIAGEIISYLRKKSNISQRKLAVYMQLIGLDLDKNAIQRIECGKRFITDIEIRAFATAFDVSIETLLGLPEELDKTKDTAFLKRKKNSLSHDDDMIL
ncbi:MAG: helix-turn-helix domain-containing protein [Treponemataceae bacterium]